MSKHIGSSLDSAASCSMYINIKYYVSLLGAASVWFGRPPVVEFNQSYWNLCGSKNVRWLTSCKRSFLFPHQDGHPAACGGRVDAHRVGLGLPDGETVALHKRHCTPRTVTPHHQNRGGWDS